MLIDQLVAEFRGCAEIIRDPDALMAALKAAAHHVGATVIGEGAARYQPHGDTMVVFLAESHIMVTTWPEYDLVLVDLLLCNPEMDARAAVDALARHLCPDGEVTVRSVERRIGPS